MKKDLIIGCSTNYNWDTLKYWVNSINKCGFEGDKVMILMNCDLDTYQRIADSGFKIIGFGTDDNKNLVYNSDIPVHVERFLHIFNYLKDNEYRFVITTDVKDVIFQRNPVEYIEKLLPSWNMNLIFSSESIKYKDEGWGSDNLYHTFGKYFYDIFKEKEIYNVGVLAGYWESMRDISSMIFQMSLNRPIRIVDQAVFNFMVSQEPYQTTSIYTKSEDGWACQLGTTMDPEKIDKFRPYLLENTPIEEDGIVKTSTGNEYYIVHQYDRVPGLKEKIEEKYR